MNLIQFQYQVTHNQTDDVKAFITALAQERGNKNLEALGQQYHFTTWWQADMYDGYRVALAKDIAQLCYGSRNVTNLLRLGAVYGIESYNLASATQNYVSLVKAHFGLARTVNTASLIHWPYVLLVGAKGETEGARKLWAYLQTMREWAEADQESREQTGLGVQENIQQQLGQPSESALWRAATDEFEAKYKWLLMLGYHSSTALLEAGKHTMRITGMDLSADLNGSPLLQDAPPQNQYSLVSLLEKRFSLPRKGREGHFLNELLANYGMQIQLADGVWQPTDKARAERIHGVPVVNPTTKISKQWSGPILEWHIDFVAKVAEWYHRSNRQEAHYGQD